jgi:hypothetical protein
MSEQHTPGPWTWEVLDGTDVGSIDGPDGKRACWFGDDEQYYPTGGTPPDQADLALMLAAPDLLAALKVMVANCTNSEGAISPEPKCRSEWLEGMVAARAAIAKAEGR